MRAMPARIDRRDALKQLGAAGVGIAVAPVLLRGQDSPITVAGRPVEIAVSLDQPVNGSPHRRRSSERQRCRMTGRWSRPRRRQSSARQTEPFAPNQSRNLTVRFTPSPPTLSVEDQEGRLVQQIALDATAPTVRFALGKGPLLGFGEGGPQFDRKGADLHQSQRAGRLSTADARRPRADSVAGQHRRLGPVHPSAARQLRPHRRIGRILTPADDALPIDVFVTASARSQGADGGVRAHHRLRGAAAAVVVRLHAVASHARRARTRSTGWRARSARRSCRATR